MTEPLRSTIEHTTDVELSAVSRKPHLIETPIGRLALVLRGEDDDTEVVAVDAWCPHIDGPLWEGSAAGDEIACPWHGWRYSLTSGQCTWAPHGDAEEAAETEIRVLAVRADEAGRAVVTLPSDPA